VQLNVRENGRRYSNGLGTVLRDWKKSINVYKNACATLSNTLLAWAGWDQFQPFGEPASRY
jgi:hypothetical protein